MNAGIGNRKTIFALATARGKSAVAVIRISGEDAQRLHKRLVKTPAPPRLAVLRSIYDPKTQVLLDRGMVIWMPAPNSFTGEDSLELHVHGARAVIEAILSALSRENYLRLASPGEFVKRALINGKVDLLEVEALSDLIDSETEAQRQFALRQIDRSWNQFAAKWRSDLIDCQVRIESELDFSDETDVTETVQPKIHQTCLDMINSIATAYARSSVVERLRGGLNILISGPPNAGKSTLLNCLSKRDVAIVSEMAGTTRDILEVRLDLNGCAVNLFDSAGIRESRDKIEKIGIQRALRKSSEVDLILWLTAADEPYQSPPQEFEMKEIWALRTKADKMDANDLEIESKTDISAETGRNIDQLIQRLATFASNSTILDDGPIVANQRQRAALDEALHALTNIVSRPLPLDIQAEELRRASFALEMLIGRIGTDDVLDAIFSRFCIGK